MDNIVLKSLYGRKSIRAYTDEPITQEEKQLILRAAVEAPSAGCQQLYTILDITDAEIKSRLAGLCDHQPFIARAPMVLVFCADCKKWYDAYWEAGCTPRKPGVGDLMLAVVDSAVAAQNAVTAAESLGIGSCYIGDVTENCAEMRECLSLPDYVFPAAMAVFGRPTEQQKRRTKPQRCDMRYIVHENCYHAMNGEELRALLAPRAGGTEFGKWCAAFCKRKYDSEFSREMTRSVGEYLEQFIE